MDFKSFGLRKRSCLIRPRSEVCSSAKPERWDCPKQGACATDHDSMELNSACDSQGELKFLQESFLNLICVLPFDNFRSQVERIQAFLVKEADIRVMARALIDVKRKQVRCVDDRGEHFVLSGGNGSMMETNGRNDIGREVPARQQASTNFRVVHAKLFLFDRRNGTLLVARFLDNLPVFAFGGLAHDNLADVMEKTCGEGQFDIHI